MRIVAGQPRAASVSGITALIVQMQNTRVDVNRDGVRVEVTTGNTQQKTTILRSRDVLGLRVYNAANESLGKIEDIAVDPNAGKDSLCRLVVWRHPGIGR